MTAYLRGFGSYLPARRAGNADLSARLGVSEDWIRDVSGIEERRYAGPEETVVSMAVAAGRDCLEKCGVAPADIAMVIVASGSFERRFPGPAATVARELGLGGAAALDLPLASAGSLFGLAIAARMVEAHGCVLVIGSEKMSPVALSEPLDRGVAILFGDGAGAALVCGTGPGARVVDALVQSDGAYAEDLRLGFEGALEMNGRSVIMQATRKIPRVIQDLLDRNQLPAAAVEVFLMHQANQNLIDRVARALNVAESRFYTNIRRYGNTSSASMLIAAEEWWAAAGGPTTGQAVCFAAFGAGFHWGALLAQG